MSDPAPGHSAVVLGGGVAGIAAAVRLAEHHVPVTLVETRKRLGGRATSHPDPQTGELIDNCQHVLLGCCTNLVDLYDRLGVGDRIAWHDRLHFFDKRGAHDVLRSSWLPAPLHLGPAMGRFRTLGGDARRAIRRAMLSAMRLGWAGRARLDETSFADWLAEQRQPAEAVERYWSVVVISACNETPERLSAATALQVFQEGFCAHRRAYAMGVPDVPLAELYDRAQSVLAERGGRVLFGTGAQALEFDGERVTGVQTTAGRLDAAAYVSALPFDRLAKIAGPELVAADARLQTLDRFEVSPIVGIHLWFDRVVCPHPHMIFVDSPLQWVFVHGGAGEAGQHLHGVISAARDWVGASEPDILSMAMREMRAYLPGLADEHRVRGKVIREKRATFSAAPGIDAVRPHAAGAVANLALAGDWTATGWPATMEGAARSGYRAAGAVLGVGDELVAPDLSVAPLARLLGLR